MMRGMWRTVGLGSGLAALALIASSHHASAQRIDEDCRCVDRDGDPIENCTCLVMPDVSDMPEMLRFSPDGDFGFPFGAPRPRLGVTVSTEQAESDDALGARVMDVMADGPADVAGVREGDVITGVDGLSLFEPLGDDVEEDFDLDRSIPVQRLLAIARDLEPGEPVAVEYLRDGQAMATTVEVQDLAGMWGTWADDFAAEFGPRMERFRRELGPRMEEFRERELDRAQRVVVRRSGAAGRYGLRLSELTPGLADFFRVEAGVLVADVEEESTLGLLPGDVVLRVGDREVTSPSRMARILGSYDEGESITFRVRRDGTDVDVMGRLSG